jgi:hypothetical protein
MCSPFPSRFINSDFSTALIVFCVFFTSIALGAADLFFINLITGKKKTKENKHTTEYQPQLSGVCFVTDTASSMDQRWFPASSCLPVLFCALGSKDSRQIIEGSRPKGIKPKKRKTRPTGIVM